VSQFQSLNTPEEEDYALRPQRLSDFIGQKEVLSNLKVYIESAIKRKSQLDHVLISGPPGLGKTTLANIIANELSTSITLTSAPAISKGGDLAKYLTALQKNEIIFIDEIHGLNKKLEEILYPAMESYRIDLSVGEGMTAQLVQIPLQTFTLIGATTRAGLISSPLKSRFGIQLRLDYYNIEDVSEILQRSAKLLKIKLPPNSALEIAKRARQTPRVANHLLRRVRDFAEVKNLNEITVEICLEAFLKMGIDDLGLETTDREILKIIIDRYKGGPVGIKPISVILGEEQRTIEDTYESYLVRIGLINRTPHGRVASELAYSHLGIKYNANSFQEPNLF
jgi:Holliday junction DNA helicase RuvB